MFFLEALQVASPSDEGPILRPGYPAADLPATIHRSEAGTSNTRSTLAAPSPHRIQCRFRNIDLIPISYASQPGLRDRLTLLR